ncbi:MAG: type II toxin-antitoxin system VapB family antitoxin [Actinomycetales bacterium]|nr:type II toxin-antitoxin system VapB family antitoxin [Actinomycetales bacterium]
MRTTVTLDDRLLAEVRVLAAAEHRTVSSVLEDALREMLARHSSGARAGRVVLPVSGDPDVAPLVDILDADALAAALGDDVA